MEEGTLILKSLNNRWSHEFPLMDTSHTAQLVTYQCTAGIHMQAQDSSTVGTADNAALAASPYLVALQKESPLLLLEHTTVRRSCPTMSYTSDMFTQLRDAMVSGCTKQKKRADVMDQEVKSRIA